MELIVSSTQCPEANLAAEQNMVTERHDDVLFLYINSPSVIVGRNQNPAAEADLEFCAAHGIPVLKRISGGGTVYHDTGNVNYSFITNTGAVSVLDTDFLSPIVTALRTFGVEASIGSRKELLIGQRKISGTASHVTRGRQLFHGTLLYNTDLELLHRAIAGNKSLRGKHVASISSPVANMIDYTEERLSTPQFFNRLAAFFREYYKTV